MVKVGAHEARTRLPRLLALVEAGESIIITRYGKEVARLVLPSFKTLSNSSFMKTLAQWKKSRKGVKLNGIKVRDLINEGRR